MSNSITRQRVASANLLEYASKNRDEGFFSDLIIIAGNESIPANRLILSCYSKYFEGMFKSILRYESTVEIRAVDGASMKVLIDFIYNGFVTINNQNVLSLMKGADYLQLEEVKQFCFEFLQSNVRLDNSLNILKAAVTYKNDFLKNKIQEYINRNLNKIVRADEFKALSKEQLIYFISILDRFHAKRTFQAVVTWTRHNEKDRVCEFPELFKKLTLDEVPINFLKKVVLKNELVFHNSDCKEKVSSAFFKSNAEKLKYDKSYLISLGGTYNLENIAVVLSPFHKVKLDLPNYAIGREGHCSLTLNDHIYSIGGRSLIGEKHKVNNEAVKIKWKQKNTKWENIASMNERRFGFGSSVYGDHLFVAGGLDEKNYVAASCEYYITAFNKWTYASSLIQSRFGNAVVSSRGCLYVFGGYCNSKCLSSAEKLEDLKGKWQNIKPMQTPRINLAAVNCSGVVYAIGGRSTAKASSSLKTVETYDSAANQWEYVCDMNIARCSHAACVLRGKIYVVGGIDSNGNTVKEIECYDPDCDSWSVVKIITDKLKNHSLIAL